MSKKVTHNIFFKLGFSSAFFSTLCNTIPVAATFNSVNCADKKLQSYLASWQTLSNFDKQSKILSNLENLFLLTDGYIKNLNELKVLTKNHICVEPDSLNELLDVKNLNDLYTKNLTVNLFEENNLNYSLKNVLNIILSNDIKGTSLDKNFDEINNTPAVKKLLLELFNYINLSKASSNDKQVFILKKLNEIEMLLKSHNINENSIVSFFNGMKKAYQVLISRRVSETLLNGEREKALKFLQEASKSRSASADGSVGFSGASIGINANIHHDEGKSEKAFYEISIGGGLSLSLGCDFSVGLGDVKAALGASGSVSGDISTSTIFFSLEQFLDAQTNPNLKNKSSSYLNSKTIKNLVLDRKNLVNTEKDLLSCFQTSIEFYLKAFNIIPVSTHLVWPSLTKASAPVSETKKTLSGNVQAVADLLSSSLKMATTVSTKAINQKISNSFLKAITDDCAANLGLTADEIVNEFANKDSLCFKIIKDFEKMLIEDSHSNDAQKIIPVLMSQLLADLRHYNSVLTILADPKTVGENRIIVKNTKHQLEDKWLGKKGLIRSKSREKVFKTAIALSSYLRQFAKTDEDLALFEQFYNELQHLLELQNFSKNSKTPNSGFKTTKNYSEHSVSGNVDVNIYDLAKASINVKYVKTENEPGYGDGNGLIISINLPFIDSLLSGVETVKNTLKKMHKETPKNEFNLEETFVSVAKSLDTVVGFTGIPTCLKVPGLGASTNGHLNLTFELEKVEKSGNEDIIIPIDNQEIALNGKSTWVLKCAKVAAVSNVNANVSGNISTGNAKLSGKLGASTTYTKGQKFKLGDECLVFPISRFNVASRCCNDTKEEPTNNYLWTSFKESSQKELYKMFSNIADTKSIAYYQVQSLYNDILFELEKSGEQSIKKNCQEIFKNFIENCKTLNKSSDFNEKAYNKTLALFEKALELNYKYNFSKKLAQNWSADFKSKNVAVKY